MKLSKELIELIESNVKDRYINKTKHPELDYYILNYSHSCQFDSKWNEATTMCRGLIVDSDYNIIARPFKKFFNLEQHQPEEIPKENFEVFSKMDGSLGIVSFLNGKVHISTRGAFFSDQAIAANKMLQDKYKSFDKFDKNYTYLVEILAPWNRIVVDYGDTEDLILLAVIDNETGRDVSIYDLDVPFPKVKKYDGLNDLSKLKELENDNEEGFVIKFESDFRVKVKFKEYVRLHRILTNVSSKNIWESLMKKDSMEELLSRVPDEFYKFVQDIKFELESNFNIIEQESLMYLQEVKNFIENKDFKTVRKIAAKKIFEERKETSSIIFRMLDNKDYSEIIWKMIKPKYEKPFKINEDS